MPHEGDGDGTVGHGRKRKPDDDNDFELLELNKLGNHANSDGGAEAAT